MNITASALPTVSITATGTPVADTPTTFTVTAAATAPATVRSVVVDFGDGTVQTFGNVTSVAHTYRSGGTFTVTATVEDTNGGRSTGSTVVAVQASAPLVSLTANSPVIVNAIVTFAVTVSQNPGNVPVQAVTFSFGDGAVREVQSLSTTYSYTSPGTYCGQRDRALHERPDGDGDRAGPRQFDGERRAGASGAGWTRHRCCATSRRRRGIHAGLRLRGLLRVQPEGGALRVHRVHDPVPVGNVHRSVENLAALRP